MVDQKNLANDIWQVAELLRGDFKQSEYGLVILPFTVLRRLECVLEPTCDAVAKRAGEIEDKGYDPFPLLTRASGVDFYNTSGYSLGSLLLADTRSNLLDYLDRFSPNVHRVFEQFRQRRGRAGQALQREAAEPERLDRPLGPVDQRSGRRQRRARLGRGRVPARRGRTGRASG